MKAILITEKFVIFVIVFTILLLMQVVVYSQVNSLVGGRNEECSYEDYTKHVLIINDLRGVTSDSLLDLRCISYAKIGKYRRALSDINVAIEINSGNSMYYMHKAMIVDYLGNISGALKYYEKSIVLDEYNAKAYYNRALLYMDLDEYELARVDLNRAIDLGFNLAHTAMAYLCENTGEIYEPELSLLQK